MSVLSDQTQILIKDYDKYYTAHEGVKEIKYAEFWHWFTAHAHPTLTKEVRENFGIMLRDIEKPLETSLEEGLSARMVASVAAEKLATLLEQFNEGADVDIGTVMRQIVEAYDMDVDRKVKTPLVKESIDELLEDDASGKGFKWRLAAMNLAMRPLISGDLLLIAARPDVGKTSFLTDQLSFMAPQINDVFPINDENPMGRKILWFNNEGPGKRIKKRIYQSCLNASVAELVAMRDQGTLASNFVEAMGGHDLIEVYDIHDFYHYEVEDIIRLEKPAMVIFDMLDNIKFGGMGNNNGTRSDQLIEAMYQWARIIGVKHDCVVMATSQISADGEELQFPLLSMLKDSKTGKQGAADAILTIGYQSIHPYNRYLGLTKNKLSQESGPRSLNVTTVFDGLRGRYNAENFVEGT